SCWFASRVQTEPTARRGRKEDGINSVLLRSIFCCSRVGRFFSARKRSDPECVWAALQQGCLIRGAVVQPLYPGVEVGDGAAFAESACDFRDEAQLNVRASQVVTHDELPAFQGLVEVAQVICNLTVDPRG